MMSYLATNSRCDIAFAVNQCTRYSINPTVKHATAMKRIGKYLKKTRLKGMTMKPNQDLTLDLDMDADFAGLWSYEDPHDPSSVRSRTGYVIILGGVPIIWKSKLQEQVALSTMEAEYIAASTAMKALVYLRRTHHEICTAINLPYNAESNVSTIFEDNRAALLLATTDPPRLTPRSKSIAVKYHWFREHLKKGSIVMKSVDSARNRANILTKPLKPDTFRTERFFTMGF